MIGILGSINLDLISYAKNLPKIGETILGDKFISAPGGKGANQALAAIRAGAEVKFYGAVGSDEFAKIALSEFKKQGTDLSDIKIVDGATGIANIMVDENGQNIICVVSGANEKINEEMAKALIASMKPSDILLLNQEIPKSVIKTALKLAKKAKILTILNIAPISLKTKELAALADIIVANQSEFNELLGEEITFENISKHAKKYQKKNGQIIIVTLGENGAIYANLNICEQIKAPKITPIDTVGAGDCFCGVLASCLADGHSLKAAIKSATIAGALSALKLGAQASFPNKDEIETFSKTIQ